ncbi:MAG TPA: potassium-transporting ATPase subunit KdpC [Candidatus Anoxymicrobiaceae bacterium]
MSDVKRIAKILVLAVVILGIAYPLLMVGVARVAGKRADGNIATVNGKAVGSREIGQNFTSKMFFHGRPSASGYDAMKSGGTNLGPDSPELLAAVRERVKLLQKENPGLRIEQIPVELLTSSASGLDPNISQESALLQVPRIAAATHISQAVLRALVKKYTHGRFLGIFGQPTVNVLDLNIRLVNRQEG